MPEMLVLIALALLRGSASASASTGGASTGTAAGPLRAGSDAPAAGVGRRMPGMVRISGRRQQHHRPSTLDCEWRLCTARHLASTAAGSESAPLPRVCLQ